MKHWGGWSKNERTDILINYLMNEYEARENDYSDWMSPSRRDLNVTILDQNGDFENIVMGRFENINAKID